jgi:hypothetical protein
MIKKMIALVGTLFFLQDVQAAYQLLGYDNCIRADKITHVPNQPWQVSADAAEWRVVRSFSGSILTQLPSDARVERTVRPSHIFNLGDVTCNYESGTVVLERNYKKGNESFPTADYIGADTNIIGDEWLSSWWNHETYCSTTVNFSDICHWGFYSRLKDNRIIA